MEHAVRARKLETGALRRTHQRRRLRIGALIPAAGRGAVEMQAVRVTEEQPYAAVRIATEAQPRRPVHGNAGHAVNLPQRAIGEPFARSALVDGMDVVVLATIDGADDVHVVDGLRRVPLGLAQHRPQHRIAFGLVHLLVDPLRKLHDEERQVLAPDGAPLADQHAQQLTVGPTIRFVLLALVPQETSQRVWRDAFQHGAERSGRTVLRRRRDRRRPRACAVLFVQRIPRHVGIGFLGGRDIRVPSIESRLPFVGFQLELLLRLAGDRTLVPGEIATSCLAGIQRVLAHPARDRRAADIAVHDADRQIGVEFGAQLVREIIGDGAHHTAVFRR